MGGALSKEQSGGHAEEELQTGACSRGAGGGTPKGAQHVGDETRIGAGPQRSAEHQRQKKVLETSRTQNQASQGLQTPRQ